MNQWEKIILWLSMIGLLTTTIFLIVHFQTHYKGLYFLKTKNYEKAKMVFLNALTQKPYLFSSRLNLALAESLQNNMEEAINEYSIVGEKSFYHKDRFQAYFNSAILKYVKKEIDSSLNFYQKALKEYPLSKEVKTNIELMMKNQQKQSKKDNQKESDQQNQQNNQQKSNQEKENQKTEEDSTQKKDPPEQNQEDIPSSENKEEQKELSQQQMQFIFKELEDREKDLKFRLQKEPSQNRQGKQW